MPSIAEALRGSEAAIIVLGPRPPYTLSCIEATWRIASEVRQQGLKRLLLAVGATYRPASMTARRALILFLASFEGLWMAFDGVRALFVGSFITPSAGPYAGEVGPWRVFFEAVSVEPNGVAVHVLFAGYGIVWLVIAAGFAARRPWSWRAMIAAAIGSLWFLPFGTLASAIQVVLLYAWRDRVM